MSVRGNLIQVQDYIYDTALDSVSTGEVFLSSKANMPPLPIGAIVRGCVAKVVTAVTGTSSTLAWGNDDDPDGYSGSAIAEASLTANAVFNGWDNGAALLWDDTNDHPIYQYVANTDDGEVSVTIGTAALTAGKVALFLEFMFPEV